MKNAKKEHEIVQACVMPVNLDPDRLEDFRSAYRQQLMPALIVEPGFSGGVVLSDAVTNKGFVVTLWSSNAAARRAEAHCRNAMACALLPGLAQHPLLELHEVLVQAGQRAGSHFARVITLPVPEEHIDSALSVYENEYLPLLKTQAGFCGVMWLANRTLGSGWGLSFWTARKQMLAADQEGEFFSTVLARLAAYFAQQPEKGYYTVDVLA